MTAESVFVVVGFLIFLCSHNYVSATPDSISSQGLLSESIPALTQDNYLSQIEKLEALLSPALSVPAHRLWPPKAPEQAKLNISWTLTDRAVVDGCFCASTNQSLPGPCDDNQLANGCKNKISEAYAWGMTRTRDSVYWVSTSTSTAHA